MLTEIKNEQKNIIFKNVIMPKQKPEKFYGNIEYKRSLVPKGKNNHNPDSIKKNCLKCFLDYWKEKEKVYIY